MAGHEFTPQEIEQLGALPKEWSQKTGLIEAYNQIRSLSGLIMDLVGEIKEAQQEHNLLGTPEYNLGKHLAEICDQLVFLAGFISRMNLEVDTYQVASSLDGFGQRSNINDRLIEAGLNLAEGNLVPNVHHFMVLLLSLVKHLTDDVNLVETMRKVIQKNQANRPRIYFGIHDSQGEPLSQEEMTAKFIHSNLLLRILRDEFNCVLTPWMSLPLADQILAWDDPQFSLDEFSNQLRSLKEILVQYTMLSLRGELLQGNLAQLKAENPLADKVAAAGLLNNNGHVGHQDLKQLLSLAGGIIIR